MAAAGAVTPDSPPTPDRSGRSDPPAARDQSDIEGTDADPALEAVRPGSPGSPEQELGWRTREVEQELPELWLVVAQTRVGRPESVIASSPPAIEDRLRELSNRFRGARAVAVRREPVPAAYRVFFRHIGLDPDVTLTPIEAAALERMLRGGFLSRGLLEDILLIALVDTGVPVWALDSEAVDGPLGIRSSSEGEPLGRSTGAPPLPAGRLVVADASAALAVLFGELAPGHEASADTRRLTLFAIQVAGVPSLYVEEALWMCREALEQP
jgi:DNA/RNA-binding domain of Phe-tRNA-synthetase-like protein